jgi:hypothetical protein
MSEIKKYMKAMRFKANPRYLRRDFIVPLYTGTEPDIVPETSVEQLETDRTNFSEGSKLTGTDKTLEQNIKDDHKAFNDYRKSIGQSTIPLDNAFIKMWQRTRLSEGGRADVKDKILNTYTKLKNKLGRNPSLAEMNRETGSTRQTIYSYLGNKKLSQGRLLEAGKTGTAVSAEMFKAKEVDKPTPTSYEGKLGVKWPNKETEEKYLKQIKGRYQYPAQSFQFNQKVKSGELLTDKGLAKEFGISKDSVERINRYIKNTEGLSYPKAEISEQEKEKRIRRASAEKKYSDPAYEQKIRGTKETQKSHMGDLYNVKVTPQTIGYAPQEINLALTGKVDPALKSIVEKQNKLYKNKPENYKQRIEDLNVKGMDYAAQTEGYKVFEAMDPKTGKRFVPITSPEKTIDPLGIAGETPLKNLTQEQKAQIELNRKAVMESQAKIPASEKRRLVQMIGSIGCPTFASGGRINFSEGSDCFNKGLKALEEGNLTKSQLNVAGRAIAESGEEGMLLKNILSRAGSGVKFTGLGVKELISVGAGPIGLGVGALLEAGQAVPELAKGDWREAIRSTTLGFLPESIVGSKRTDLLRMAKTDEEKNAAQLLFDYQDKVDEANRIQGQIEALKNPEFTSVEGYESDPGMKIKQLEGQLKDLDTFLNANVKKVNKVTPTIVKLSDRLVESNVSNIIDPATGKPTIFGKIIGTTSVQDKKKLSEEVQQQVYQEEQPEEKIQPFVEPNIISPDDYINEFKQYRSGGRVGLKDGGGPKIGRRGFLGFLIGAASAPFVGKLMKGKKTVQAAKVAGKVLPKVSGMPEWFSPLVSRIQKEGIDVSPKATRVEDIIKVKKLEVPAPDGKSNDIITMTEYPDGRIDIEANVYGGAFDSPFSLEYRPPRSDINLDTGAEIKSPGDFTVVEQRPRPESGNPGKIEIDYESMSVDDTISDLERLEKIGTGKRIHPRRVEQRTAARKYIEDNPHEDVVNRYPDGEIYYDQMRDEGLLDE